MTTLNRWRRALVASTALTALAVTAPALADFEELLSLGSLGGNVTFANALSSDGSTVVGYSTLAGNGASHAFRWNGGAITDLGTLGGTTSQAYGVSADGSVVAGVSSLAGGQSRAFRWSGGVMTDLGTLGGTLSVAYGISGNGAVVVGAASNGSNQLHAFRWSGGVMTDLGTLGGAQSLAQVASFDGSVLAGASHYDGSGEYHAFRWTGGVMADLGTFGGTQSFATGISADGSVVVGSAYNASGRPRAFRWSGGVMTNLGTLPGGDASAAYSVSADGSVIVGVSSSTTSGGEAMRWKASTGMQSIRDILTASGVNIAGWTFVTASGVSADGSVIMGLGTSPFRASDSWIARCTTTCAVTTTIDVTQSFSGQSGMGQTGNAALSNTLGTLNEVATQAGGPQDGSVSGGTAMAFGYGGYDSDPAASGTLGMTMKLPNQMVGGVLASANYVRTNMVYDGNAKMQGGSAGAFIGRAPNAGLQWLVGVSAITLKGDVTRGYLNGNTQVSSQGNTTGNGYGVSGRIGWTFDNVWRTTQVTPFASYSVTRMHFNGYTETGGPFPAQMNSFNDTTQIARIGADARYTFAPGKWVWGTLASAHRLNSSKTDNITGTIIGLFDVSAPASAVAKDWIETTAGVRWPAWKNGAVTASLTASIPTKYPTTYQARLGVTQAF